MIIGEFGEQRRGVELTLRAVAQAIDRWIHRAHSRTLGRGQRIDVTHRRDTGRVVNGGHARAEFTVEFGGLLHEARIVRRCRCHARAVASGETHFSLERFAAVLKTRRRHHRELAGEGGEFCATGFHDRDRSGGIKFGAYEQINH